jgi:hypothetical protein
VGFAAGKFIAGISEVGCIGITGLGWGVLLFKKLINPGQGILSGYRDFLTVEN